MSRPGILLTVNAAGWSLCGLSKAAPTESLGRVAPKELASQLVSFAEQHTLNIQKVMIGVSSDSVLFASLPNEASAEINSNQSLRFALEGALPVDADNIAADIIQSPRIANGQAIPAVAIELSQILHYVEAIENANARVQYIVPNTILVLQHAVSQKLLPVPSISIWSLGNAEQIEWITLRSNGTLEDWQVSGDQLETVVQHLHMLDAVNSNVCVCGDSAELQRVMQGYEIEVHAVNCDFESLARKGAEAILTGRVAPWCDLRRDKLAMRDPFRRDRSTLRRLAFAIGILFASLCGTFLWKANEYRSVVEQTKSKQAELFRSAFPNQRLPSAMLARIKSEHTKAKGVRKSDPAVASPISALATLHQIVEGLSDEFPFAIEELRIESGRIALEVELLSQQDAGKVAAALAKIGFDVEPPATTLGNEGHIKAIIDATAGSQAFGNGIAERGQP